MGCGVDATDRLKGDSKGEVDRRRREVPDRLGLGVLRRRLVLGALRHRHVRRVPGRRQALDDGTPRWVPAPRASETCEVYASRQILEVHGPPVR